jgi:type I restriction enzyme, S subunit
MRSNYKRLGNYIREVDKRDADKRVDLLLGVSIQKKFMPSIANTIGTDMSTYKIVKRNQFAYGPVTSRNGDKISIALLEDYEEAIVSQAYMPFEVIDTNELLPQYLMMWFRRPEFDRYARFMSHGSAREIFGWEEMRGVELPIPHIDKQREIVKEYNTIVDRINLNNQLIQKLEEAAQAIYKQWFVEGVVIESLPDGWRIGTVSDLSTYSSNRVSIDELNLHNYVSTENMLPGKKGIIEAKGIPDVTTATGFEIGNILISNIRPYFKKIWLVNSEGGCSNDVLCFVPKENIPSLYLYQILETDAFFEYVMAGSKGTKMPRGDKKWIMNYPVLVPSENLLKEFDSKLRIIQNSITSFRAENQKLSQLKELLLSKLATIEN